MTLHLEAPPTGTRKRWAGLAVLAAGLSMIVIDGTIVGVSLPDIISSFQYGFTSMGLPASRR